MLNLHCSLFISEGPKHGSSSALFFCGTCKKQIALVTGQLSLVWVPLDSICWEDKLRGKADRVVIGSQRFSLENKVKRQCLRSGTEAETLSSQCELNLRLLTVTRRQYVPGCLMRDKLKGWPLMAFSTHIRGAFMDFSFKVEGSLPTVNLCGFLHRKLVSSNDSSYFVLDDWMFLSRI